MDIGQVLKDVERAIASHNTWAGGAFPSVRYWSVNTGEYVLTCTHNYVGEKEK